MDRPHADDSMDKLKTQFIRLVISTFDEVDPASIPDEKILELLDKLNIVDQGRMKYLETLTDFLYEGLRPLLIQDRLIQTSEEEPTGIDSPEEDSAHLTLEEPQAKSIEKKVPSPFPENLDLPKAVVGKTYSFDFDLEQYYNGHILSPEIEGLDAVRGMEFSFSDLVLKGSPKEPGVYDMVLLFLREDKMDRDTIRFRFTVEPNLEDLPKEINIPAGRVDDEYEKMVPLDRSYKFDFQLEGAAEIGLDFDPDTMIIMGTPTRSGTFYLPLHFSWEGMREKSAGSTIVSIKIEDAEDSFWQNIFPDPNSKFAKSLEEHNQVAENGLWLIGASIRGQRHRHLGLHREDDFQIKCSKRLGWHIIAVADGHPDAHFARKGSELASKVAEQVVNKRLELFFSRYEGKVEELLQPQNEEAEKKLADFLNYTLTTAIYNSFLYIKRFAESERLPLDNFATTLKLIITYPLGKKGYFIASSIIGDGTIGIYHDKKHTLELIRDKLPKDESHGPHLLTNPNISEKTKLLNQNLNWLVVEDFSYLAVISEGAKEALFHGERTLESPTSWSHYWQVLKKQVFHGDSDEFSQNLLTWLENPSENKEAFEDRTLVLMTQNTM